MNAIAQQPLAFRVAFFLNIYNSLMLHAMVVLQPQDVAAKFAVYAQAAYRLGSLDPNSQELNPSATSSLECSTKTSFVLTLDDIEHGILRANRPQPSAKDPKFRGDDPRLR